MGKIIVYSASSAARAAFAELLPQSVRFDQAYSASKAAEGADLMVADLAAAEPAGWLGQIQIPTVALVAEKRELEGAARVFVKPCRWREVAAQIARQLAQAAQSFAVGPYVYDPAERVLLSEDGEETARLTEKEAQILVLLAQRGPLSRQEVIEGVWAHREGVETHALETHIYRLRQKLGDDAANPRILLSVDGGGYALAGE